jgi:3-oxoacyl-[acyl-carrier-protein] synthase-3
MIRTAILGTGRALPERVVTNDDLAAMMDTSDEWITARTGIKERRWIRPGETGVGMARVACEQALEMAGVTPAEVDAIVFATSTPDHCAPGNGVFLQRELGVGQIPALDIRTQCSGFVYALSVADAFIRGGTWKRVLVIGEEVQSTRMDLSTEGRSVSVIFADGAGAALVGATEEPGRGILGFDLHSDGSFAEKLWADGPGAIYHPGISIEQLEAGCYWLQMDGREVFRHAVARMPESVRAVLAATGIGLDEVKLVIPHQANLRISEMIQKELGLPDGVLYNNIQRYGNTTAATIPIALDECVRAGRLESGDLLVMTAFGSGFIWGSCVVRW